MGKNFDAFFEKAKWAADGAGKKATETWELSKLKWQSLQVGSKIKEQYEKLGSAVYNMSKADYDNPELISSLVDEIDDLNEELEEIDSKISALKKNVKCPCCGKQNALSSQYCSHCGCRLSPEEEAPQTELFEEEAAEENSKE